MSVVAKTAIRANETFLSAPLRSAIFAQTCLSGSRIQLESQVAANFTDMTLLALCLLDESTMKGSYLQPFLDVLPTETDTPVSYTEEELQELQGHPAEAEAKKAIDNWHSEYQKLKTEILDRAPEEFPSSVFTEEAVVHWLGIVHTRSWKMPSGLTAMIPCADMINHDPSARAMSVAGASRACEFTADRDYQSGEQVFITYGTKSNAQLLLLYGFAIDKNPYDSVGLNIVFNPSSALDESKRSILQQLRLPLSQSILFRPGGQLDEAILTFLRVVYLSAPELDVIEGAINKHHIVSLSNERLVMADLIKKIIQFEKQFLTTVEDDDEILSNPSSSHRMRMMAVYRKGEKTMVSEVRQKLMQRWSSMLTAPEEEMQWEIMG